MRKNKLTGFEKVVFIILAIPLFFIWLTISLAKDMK